MTCKSGRQLAGMANGSVELSFDYNESGLRTSKIVSGAETPYIWSEGLANINPIRCRGFDWE